MIFEYSELELDYLKQRDDKLSHYIDKIGKIERSVNPDVFKALVESIISQQISGKAAKTVYDRLSLICDMTTSGIALLDDAQIQKCGMSMRKAQYIKNAACAGLDGTVDFAGLIHQSDDDVISSLTKIKGVGVWTAEMMLIFSLTRRDVVSYLDSAIRRGIMKLYGLDTLTKNEFYKYKQLYSPYGTVASFYLWAISDISQSLSGEN